MIHPINPNTDLPMSFRVEKIQQMRQTQSEQQLSYINQQLELENEQKQQRINENEKAEQAKIMDEQQQQSFKDKEDNDQSNTNEKKEQQSKKMTGVKGSIIDVKV